MGVNFNSTSDDFVTNEAWLVQRGSPACSNLGYTLCWIEAGFIASQYYTAGSPRYFLAYRQPNQTFVITPFTTMTYPVDSLTTVRIFSYNFDSNFTVAFANDAYNQYFSTPVTNSYTPNQIQTGSELSGTRGATSFEADFAQNAYAGNLGRFYYQTNDGAVNITGRNPPYGGWSQPPSQSSTGGYFYSYCC